MLSKVLVLLSTYNGEKYLPEQFTSLFNQKNIDIHLLIRDDGSSDNTIALIESTAASHPGKVTLEKGSNMGPAKSFRWLMSHAVTFKYITLPFVIKMMFGMNISWKLQ